MDVFGGIHGAPIQKRRIKRSSGPYVYVWA